MRRLLAAVAALVTLGATSSMPATAQNQQAPTIAAFTAAPALRSVTLSPNGQFVAYIRDTAEQQVLFVADLTTNQTRPIQSARGGNAINWVRWKSDDRLIFGVQQEAVVADRASTGTRLNNVEGFTFRRWRVFSIGRDGTGGVEMFAEQQRRLVNGLGSTFLIDRLPNNPTSVLLSAIDNDGVGIWRADITTGRAERILDGSYDTITYGTDGEGNPVVRMDAPENEAAIRIMRRAPDQRGWTLYREVRRAAGATNSPDFQILGPAPGAGRVYALARLDSQDLLSLHIFDTTTGQLGEALQQGQQADVDAPWVDPRTREVIAHCEYATRMRCTSQDRDTERHLRAVEQFLGEDVTVYLSGISVDGNVWLLYADGPREPGGFFIYDRAAANVRSLAEVYPEAPIDSLSPTRVVEYATRDGQRQWAYITAQAGVEGPRPTVIMPHGGPEARDYFEYDAYVQFLASRGYVVVQPNFRGGDGFGRAFADAGRGQWGQRMQHDIEDATRHVIEAGIADAQRVCIVGASYGGYAALAGVTLTPDLYRCAISISGVSDLVETLRQERLSNGRVSLSYHYWLRSIGDPRENRDALRAVSPALLADRVTAPVLLIHGTADEVVLPRQSELMQRALERAGKPVRHVTLEGAGHAWAAWTVEQRTQLFTETESFLAQHLRGGN
jgi:dipeptidyl aminopeptidase/acylaminoacyl peptidase